MDPAATKQKTDACVVCYGTGMISHGGPPRRCPGCAGAGRIAIVTCPNCGAVLRLTDPRGHEINSGAAIDGTIDPWVVTCPAAAVRA